MHTPITYGLGRRLGLKSHIFYMRMIRDKWKTFVTIHFIHIRLKINNYINFKILSLFHKCEFMIVDR